MRTRLLLNLLFFLPLAGGTGPLEPFITPSRLCALHRPPGWLVQEEPGDASFALEVRSPDGASRVRLAWTRTGGKAVEALRRLFAAELRSHPDARLSEVYASGDGARAVATVRFRQGGAPCAGRFFVEADGRRAVLQSYLAPEAQLAAQRAILMNVMMSVAFIQPPRGAQAPPPLRWTLVERRAQDGSLRLKVPEEWTFLAVRGTVLAGAPGGGAGFIFTTFSGNPVLRGASVLQGVIGQPYLPPGRTLPVVLQGFGHRDINLLADAPDPAAAAQYRAAVGRPAEASDLVATWTSKGGSDCLGGFKVINAVPVVMGQWSCIVAGVWGPRRDFGRHLPLLEQVAASYEVNDAYARRYIQDGLANLRRLQAETSRKLQELAYARADQQKAWEDRQARKDYMDSKWDDYRRGNSYWVSDLEGGKVYQTDPHGTRDTATGDYYEGGGYTWTQFEGRNPRHASETMREVSSYELEHGVPPG